MYEPYITPFTFCLSRTHSICNEFSKCETKTLKVKRKKKKDKSIPYVGMVNTNVYCISVFLKMNTWLGDKFEPQKYDINVMLKMALSS